MTQSSWTPNYEALEVGDVRFDSETYGNWHINPRFKYKRIWTNIVEEDGLGTCDENDTWQEEMANQNRWKPWCYRYRMRRVWQI